jgi:hypothetical protein
MLALLILLVTSTVTHAQKTPNDRWFTMPRGGKDDPTVRYDTQSMVRDSDRVNVWVSFRYDTPHTNDSVTNFTEVRYHQVLDCTKRRTGMVSWVAYRANGSTAGQETVPDGMMKWLDVVPESQGEAIVNALCKPR